MLVIEGTMPKDRKLKAAVRARMAVTGRGYQETLQEMRGDHHGGPPREPPDRRVEAIILHIIAIARRREAEQEARDREHPEYFAIFERLRRGETLPAERELTDYLATLSDEHLWKVAVIGYAGRDDESILSVNASIHVNTFDDGKHAAWHLTEKSPLAEYLTKGLARAQRDGFDLESALPTFDGETRYVTAYIDRETPSHAGAGGLFQVVELSEDGRDVTEELHIDVGRFFETARGVEHYLRMTHGVAFEVDLERA